MEYPPAVIDKAKKQERILQAVAAGIALPQACAKVGLTMDKKTLARLQKKYEQGGQTWTALLDGRFGRDIKANSAIKAWLYERKEQDKSVRAPQLVREIKEKFGVEFRAGHINYLLRKKGLTAPVGRPYRGEPESQESETNAQPPSLDNAGIFFPGRGENRSGASGPG